MEKRKYYSGQTYIYLLMAFKLCLQNMQDEKTSKAVYMGNDNGMVGGQNYYRRFRIILHNNEWLLTETRNGRNFADFSRTFVVKVKDLAEPEKTKAPAICDYIDEYGDNCGKNWIH